ncbi:MAG: hypothetical protein P1S60_13265, partial [Anaerolineae bacterium]|nr:hypothetical protein [Anaerolineae bacterium]
EFTFDLLKPVRKIQGKFALQTVSEHMTKLTLSVSTSSGALKLLFKLPLLKQAVQNQINAEVQHIKTKVKSSEK